MRNYYEILLALVVGSNEEEIKGLLDRLERSMNTEGAIVEEVQRLDRKEFAYPHRHMRSALYVNFMITAEPAAIDKIRQKFVLMEEVTLQNFFQKGKVSLAATKTSQPAKKSKKVEAAV